MWFTGSRAGQTLRETERKRDSKQGRSIYLENDGCSVFLYLEDRMINKKCGPDILITRVADSGGVDPDPDPTIDKHSGSGSDLISTFFIGL